MVLNGTLGGELGKLILTAIIVFSLPILSYSSHSHEFVHCHLPQTWHGDWRTDRQGSAVCGINSTSFLEKECIKMNKDYFIFNQIEDNKNCTVCRIIIEKHHNVLQYRDTPCEHNAEEDFTKLCRSFETDADYNALYRKVEYNRMIDCPFRRGEYKFTYTRNEHHQRCDNPLSKVKFCEENSRFVFKYEACENISGSESEIFVVNCFATWNETGNYFLVAEVTDRSNRYSEYQCFNYKTSHNNLVGSPGIIYEVARSGQGTCNGLASPTEGSEILVLTEEILESCSFPDWLGGHWSLLNKPSMRLDLNKDKDVLTTSSDIFQNDRNITVRSFLACRRIVDRRSSQTIIYGEYLSGCLTCYYNTTYRAFNKHVIMVSTPPGDKKCNDKHKSSETLPPHQIYVKPGELEKLIECPIVGQYSVTNVTRGGRPASTMCVSTKNGMVFDAEGSQFRLLCGSLIEASYTCHSSWKRNNFTYILASTKDMWHSCFRIGNLNSNDMGPLQVEFADDSRVCAEIFLFSPEEVEPHNSWSFILIKAQKPHTSESLESNDESSSTSVHYSLVLVVLSLFINSMLGLE